MAHPNQLKWGEVEATFGNPPLPYTWGDVWLAEEARKKGGMGDINRWLDEDKKKKKAFIKLIAKVSGVKYEETKLVLNRKIKVKDVKMVFKKVLNKNIMIEFDGDEIK